MAASFPDNETMTAICMACCADCARGFAVRQRADTREWVHDRTTETATGGVSVRHSFCWASGIRNSRFGEVLRG